MVEKSSRRERMLALLRDPTPTQWSIITGETDPVKITAGLARYRNAISGGAGDPPTR